MVTNRQTPWLLFLLALTLALVSCGSLASPANPPVETEGDAQVSPLTQRSPLPTATSMLVQEPLDLVVLHTNDNWGETEPCG